MRPKKESIVKITVVLVLAGIAAVLAAGCSNDLPVASTLERTRVLGARVEVEGDPLRNAAGGRHGEDVGVAVILAGEGDGLAVG